MLEATIGAAFRSDEDWGRHHTLVIYGAGLIGISAAVVQARRGEQVTLVDSHCDLAWEISRAFACARRPAGRDWDWLIGELEASLQPTAGLGFAAWVEIAAARLLAELGVRVLFFSRPVAASAENGGLSRVLFATKGGLRALSARRFLDASEAGVLAALAGLDSPVRKPVAYKTTLLVDAESWYDDGALEPGSAPSERVLHLTSEGPFDQATLREGLSSLREAGPVSPLVSASSFRPLPVYAQAPKPICAAMVGNLVVAAPGRLRGDISDLEDRVRLGRAAAKMLVEVRPFDRTDGTSKLEWSSSREHTADVAVLGAGTGGAVAAIAAARGGADALCADINRFAGGTATGSGIHHYWYGVSGGLQEEIDDLTQSLSPLFGAANQTKGYHPEARRIALEQLFARHGVRFLRDSMLFSVVRDGARVRSCAVATEDGVVEVVAPSWIDATGDGDLSAIAGASFRAGRDSDGVASPYTQSAVQLLRASRRWYLGELNFDSGWVDPSDAGDLTRARLQGLEQLAELAEDSSRLVAVAPMVGVRQARQINTEYTLSLNDLISRNSFADAVGYVGAHFDNHMLDYQLESKEAIFWVWCAHQWRTPVASQMPLRALRPKGLSNVLLACRALGVSRDAHHAIRMIRDMQRLGEAAGTVAAADGGRGDFDASLRDAQDALQATGALFPSGSSPKKQTRYGPDAITHFGHDTDLDADAAARDLQSGERSARLWSLFRDPEGQGKRVRHVLTSNDAKASWLAACISGLWGQQAAETRLLSAIEMREIGDRENTAKYCTDPAFKPFPPDWVVAISVLRECGTARSVPALVKLLDDRELGLDVRVAVVLALTAIFSRGSPADAAPLMAAADLALTENMPGLLARPQQSILLAGERISEDLPTQRHDMRWKLILAFAQLFDAAGIVDPRLSDILLEDPRAVVRNAYKAREREQAA